MKLAMSHRTYSRAKPLAWRNVGGRVVIIHGGRGEVSELNETASEIWRQLDAPAPIELMASWLVNQFDVDAASAQEDASTLIKDLENLGLVHGSEPASP